MSSGSLTFQLPEEREDFKLAQNALKYKLAIEDMATELRSAIKYPKANSDQSLSTLENVRKRFYEILKENECEIS